MSDKHYYEKTGEKPRSRRRLNLWLVIGVLVLIILLFVWLTVADFTGNTDVAAYASAAMIG